MIATSQVQIKCKCSHIYLYLKICGRTKGMFFNIVNNETQLKYFNASCIYFLSLTVNLVVAVVCVYMLKNNPANYDNLLVYDRKRYAL